MVRDCNNEALNAYLQVSSPLAGVDFSNWDFSYLDSKVRHIVGVDFSIVNQKLRDALFVRCTLGVNFVSVQSYNAETM